MKKQSLKKGMTLIELVIVIGILGVLFTAVYMFFVKGTEQFHFTRRQNHLATTGRLALEMLTDEIVWAGYMPGGGWTEEQWEPVEAATEATFDFYADRDGNLALSPTDYRNIYLDTTENILHITDDGSMDRVAGTDITAIQFTYLNSSGATLPKPLSKDDRGFVRHVVVKLTLQSTYMGDVYQTVMRTMITPRNLGVYHNFDPLFYLPPPPDAKIVVNIDGDSLTPTPTVHQIALVNRLDAWGFTLVQLSDDELELYDYDSSGVDLVILRNITGGTSSHYDYSLALADTMIGVGVPIIMLDPDDAVEVFAMGEGAGNSSSPDSCFMTKIVVDHPIHDNVTADPFKIYATNSGTHVTTLDSLYPAPFPGTELITASNPELTSGVCVINQSTIYNRRVLLCAPDFASYSTVGERFLLNIILWALPAAGPPPLGEEINTEGFEGESPGEVPTTLWDDDLEEGVMIPDSIPIYTDFGTNAKDMIWTLSSTGFGEILDLTDSLEMHRTILGGFDRNIAATIVDLTGYNEYTNELYITVETNKGNLESINGEDGVFLYGAGGSLDTLVEEDFENMLLANGDVEFWGDLDSRHRIHSPGWNNPTSFVTLDSRVDGGDDTRARMMIELDTSTLEDGTAIVVHYSMTDHGDETTIFNPLNNRGDYIGWSLGNDIDNTLEDHENLAPALKPNGVWDDYTYTFTPSGSMPSTVYIIFSQYENYRAITATQNDGISFDDITIVADNTTLNMTRIGTPSFSTGWEKIAIDLDDAAILNGAPFSSSYGLALSQYGLGPRISQYGIMWQLFELGVIEERYSLPGWSHDAMNTGDIDDWTLEDISGNHKWTLHANNSAEYSNHALCWLQTPEITIPPGTNEPVLTFVHSYDMENSYDYGWIEVSTDGGTIWNFFEGASYDDDEGYNGTQSTTTEELDLSAYVGQTIRFRFVFDSDLSVTESGWTLDNFEATGTISGVVINEIGFKPISPSGVWYFNEVDIYLGNTTETVFTDDGEWDKSTMQYFGTFEVGPSVTDWVTITLGENYILPVATNLVVKMEMSQTSPSSIDEWFVSTHPNMARWETSFSSNPSFLKVVGMRPVFMINTLTHGVRYVDADSTANSDAKMPLAFSAYFGGFEGIYTMEDFGFSEDNPWVAGGDNNDWEVGVPLFIPDVDPALLTQHGNRIAGTDLTDNGYYTPDAEWNWFRSGAYDLSETAAYDSVALSYDRCLRRALNDEAFIQMAFTTSPEPPTENSDWIMIKKCDYDDDNWTSEVIQLTSFFQEAIANGKTHYFVRFVLSAGPFAEKGGWNIDNVGFYGRFAE